VKVALRDQPSVVFDGVGLVLVGQVEVENDIQREAAVNCRVHGAIPHDIGELIGEGKRKGGQDTGDKKKDGLEDIPVELFVVVSWVDHASPLVDVLNRAFGHAHDNEVLLGCRDVVMHLR